jgi:colanic acid/amylovoran biosynthesis glycosyltransferase
MLGRGRKRVDGRALHLLVVGVKWPPETFLQRKFAELAARGMRVTVVADPVIDERFALPGVELLRVQRRTPGTLVALRAGVALALSAPGRLLRLARNVLRAPPALRKRRGGAAGLYSICVPLARLRPDVVQFEWNTSAVDYLSLFDVWDCPVLTSCWGSDLTVYPYIPTLQAYADCLPEVFRRVRLVHCVSESLKREAIGFGMEPARARVIRPGVDPQVFRPGGDGVRFSPRLDQVLRVTAVGDMRWEKGYEYTLQTIRALVDGGVPARLEIVGALPDEGREPSTEQRRIRHTIADLELEPHVRLQPWLTPSQLNGRLGEADAFLHASVAEGIPYVVLEAMACGVPVVTTDVGGVSEAVTDGVEGFVVVARDPGQLAAALGVLWRDPPMRRRMGEAAHRRINSEFTLAVQIQAFMAMYQEAVA